MKISGLNGEKKMTVYLEYLEITQFQVLTLLVVLWVMELV